MALQGPGKEEAEVDAMDVDEAPVAAPEVKEFSIAEHMSEDRAAACAKFDIDEDMLLSGFEPTQVRSWGFLQDPSPEQVLAQQIKFANDAFPGLYFERFTIDIPEDLAKDCAYWGISVDELLEGFEYKQGRFTANNDINDLQTQQINYARMNIEGLCNAKAAIYTSSEARLDHKNPSPAKFNEVDIRPEVLEKALDRNIEVWKYRADPRDQQYIQQVYTSQFHRERRENLAELRQKRDTRPRPAAPDAHEFDGFVDELQKKGASTLYALNRPKI